MKKRQLGQTDIYLSELGFGGASIGNLYEPCSDQAAFDVIENSWQLGIRYFDTAPEYGHGLSERRFGDALRSHPRDEYILSTKVGELLFAKARQLPPENKFINKLPFHLKFDYSYDAIMRGFEDSLQRLGLNRIDIILVHDLDSIIHQPNIFKEYFKTYVESGYKALDKLRSEGSIRAIGLGVKQWQVCFEAMKHGDYECFMLQGNYTIMEQPAFEIFLPLCLKKKVSILLAGPYASGILATGPVKGAYFHHKEAPPEILKRVKFIQDICKAHATPLQAVAIQFPLKHPAIASVVIGSKSPVLMQDNINYAQFKIPSQLWNDLRDADVIPKEAPTE